MQYVIYDLEFTVSRHTNYSSEIIDIGAVKCTQEGDRLVTSDRFHTYVRPSNRPVLSADTIRFTGIGQKQIDAAPLFGEAASQFAAWLGEPGSYYLCAWGPDDRMKLISHCRTHRTDLFWICNTNDIQKQISAVLGEPGKYRQLSLGQALERCGIVFDGRQHSALDDAVNTAELFIRYFDQLDLVTNNAANEESISSKVVYSSSDDEDEGYNPFGNLANLFRDNT